MTVHEDLPTQYHQQDTDYYCGAATAQMVLEQCGAGLLGQTGLYNDNHSHSTAESGWYTAPDGLTWTMNNRQSSKYFVLDALNTEDAISRMIAWTIHHYRVAPIAMVYGSAHWIVVRGYTASATPTSSGDVGYTLSGFDINNPWPPCPAGGPPPPHTGSDVCGSGGTRGVADEHISYSTWRTDYMTGVTGGHWNGKFIAVCDPEPPPTRHPDTQEPQRPSRFDGEELIDRRVAAELSIRALDTVGLTKRENWAKALSGTETGDPILVQRLDRADSFYWVVPQTRGGIATAVVNIDARFGNYQQARALPDPQGTALLVLDRTEVEELILGRLHQLTDRRGELLIRPGLACISDQWVWKPCAESLSPFYPFKLITYGADRLYVRSDGRIFHSLTTTGRGI
ncbi:hypothetical protein D1871_14425 [Nakamurella silvestris]|nr:hypothetical protein D1871_14425 [Nakamurella silvestris]